MFDACTHFCFDTCLSDLFNVNTQASDLEIKMHQFYTFLCSIKHVYSYMSLING